jgi:alpha-D-ribose 1-methylphosphonate 5-triphosphate synthase subunit PhnG
LEKKRLTKILAKTDRAVIAALSARIIKVHPIVVIKEPAKTLAMIKMRDPVKQGMFYIGEIIVCEAVVEIGGVKGMAVNMGVDMDKTLNMAIIDAAINKGVFDDMDELLSLEKNQEEILRRENAMHLKTMVNFTSMDEEVPQDDSSFKKA